MKKIFTLFIAMIMAFMTVSAQTTCDQTNYVGQSRFFDNTSIGLYGGVQTNLSEWNAPQGAVTGLVINKELTPTFGLTLEGQVGWNNLGNWYTPGYHIHNGTAVDNVTVMLAGRTNLFNLFGGYKARVFDMETVVGVGYMHAFGHYFTANDLVTKFGLNFNFNLGKEKAWTIVVQPSVNLKATHNANLHADYGVGQLTAGVTYRFKTSNGTHRANKAVLYDCEEVNSLREALLEAQLTNAALTAKLMEQPAQVLVTETVVDTLVYEILPKVQFEINSAKIPATSMANLVDIANVMKETEGRYVINGYASMEGPEQFNKTLSLERATAIRNALVELGVENDRLEVVGNGSTEEFGSEYPLNRVVVFDEVETD